MLGTRLGGAVQLRWEDPLVRPLEKISVCWRGVAIIILTRNVQGEIEEGLTATFDEGREAETATGLT